MAQRQTRPRANRPVAAHIQERVDRLGDELRLAIRYNRPSLLFAVCRSETIARQAQRALAAALRALEQKTSRFNVALPDNTDIPLRLSRKRNRARTVYFVQGLKAGGTAALQALNFRREYLVDNQVRAVFWLTEEEERAISRSAPDFWAFRHGVVYFPEMPAPRAR